MSFRKDYITKPIHKWAKGVLPTLSETEAEAVSSGDVHFEAELFSGNPDWNKLRSVKAPTLTDAERAFIDGPCRAFCDMVDGWEIDKKTGDLPPDGMLIDHRDGNRANDAWGNLRLATYAQNAWNRKDKRKSAGGRRGVYKVAPGKWEASIICNGKTIRLGRFTDRGEAIKAREAGERAAYGEFARAA